MSLSTLRRNGLPSEQWLDVMLTLKRSDIASMELSNTQFGAMAKAHAKVLPLHFLMRLGIEPIYKVGPNDVDPEWGTCTWPSGAEWQISYGHTRRESLARPDKIIRPFPDDISAWTMLCELIKRSCVCGEIKIKFVDFSPELVEMFVNAEKTGNVMQRCSILVSQSSNDAIFRAAVDTEDKRYDYRLFFAEAASDNERATHRATLG